MSKRKAKTTSTYHGKKRFSERYEGKEDVDVMIRKAMHYGIFVHQVPQDNPLYIYMENKVRFKNKKVKLLEGYVFVLTKSTNRLITFYPIPEDLIEAYQQITHVEEENRLKWKQTKLLKKQRNGSVL